MQERDALAFGESKRACGGCKKQMTTWSPKVCKIMDFMDITMGLGPLCYTLGVFRY